MADNENLGQGSHRKVDRGVRGLVSVGKGKEGSEELTDTVIGVLTRNMRIECNIESKNTHMRKRTADDVVDAGRCKKARSVDDLFGQMLAGLEATSDVEDGAYSKDGSDLEELGGEAESLFLSCLMD